MTKLRSELLITLRDRGFLHQCTDLEGLDAALAAGPVTAYIGFDATAPSLHIGSLLPVMMLHWIQQTGHRPIVLMGGGTTKVGDPSGKDETRKVLSDDAIAQNMAGIRKVFDRFLRFGDGPTDAVMVDNDAWLRDLGYVAFLREFGRHFTINRMLTFDSVRLRLEREQPLTFLEFNYMIMQSFDFYELCRRFGCTLQLGASDQRGNIVNGVELVRRVLHRDVFGFTCPLLTKSDGTKMGKSAAGAIWLNEELLTPHDFYQYLRNVDDRDVGRLLRLLTTLPLDEVARLERLEGAELNVAKKRLAFETTRLCHGEEAATKAAETARLTFEEGQVSAGLPTHTIHFADIRALPAYALFKAVDLAPSGLAAQRLIEGGGARIDGSQINDAHAPISSEFLEPGRTLKLSAGKKKHVLVIVGDR